MPWFRFYVEAVADRKLRRQDPATRWLWVAVLAAARQSPEPGRLLVVEGVPMDEHDLADFAALSVAQVRKGLAALADVDTIERDAEGAWVVLNWSARQFESDDVTARTRRHRSNRDPGNVPRNVPTSSEGTPPETETETEPPPTPSPSATGPARSRGGGGLNGLGPEVSGAVRALAKVGSWRSVTAALEHFAETGTLDRLVELHRRFPHAPAGDLVQLLDGGPLLRRYVAEEARPA
jgi:hypothetical protein